MNIEIIPIKDINPAEYNPRVISKAEFNGLVESLKTYGQQENLIVNKDNTLISGHQRLEAMKHLKLTEAVCNRVDLNKHEEKKLNVLMNSQAISGQWDEIKLAEILEGLKLDDNYESLRLNELEPLDLSTAEVEEDEAPEVDASSVVSIPGEIYQLGRHRVMCGDSTNQTDIKLLMGDVKADMVFTDPPYGMSFEGAIGTHGEKRKKEAILNDSLSSKDNDEFLDKVITNIRLFSKGAFYITYWRLGIDIIMNALSRNGLKWRNLIIWRKNNFNLSNSDYKSQYEPMVFGWGDDINEITLYGWNGSHDFYGKKNESDVWEIELPNVWEFDKTKSNNLHPTMKPIKLCTRAICNSSKKGGSVLDLFLGSGSTLIACEQTDRTCYGMELDPKYVDVIRKRYAKFIGKEESWQEVTPIVKQ